jgi:hypothetical protein
MERRGRREVVMEEWDRVAGFVGHKVAVGLTNVEAPILYLIPRRTLARTSHPVLCIVG